MLTYQDVVTVKVDALSTAAGMWDEMASGFDDLEDVYKATVQSVTYEDGWAGLSAAAAAAQFAATRKQFAGAQVEARAIASLRTRTGRVFASDGRSEGEWADAWASARCEQRAEPARYLAAAADPAKSRDAETRELERLLLRAFAAESAERHGCDAVVVNRTD